MRWRPAGGNKVTYELSPTYPQIFPILKPQSPTRWRAMESPVSILYNTVTRGHQSAPGIVNARPAGRVAVNTYERWRARNLAKDVLLTRPLTICS